MLKSLAEQPAETTGDGGELGVVCEGRDGRRSSEAAQLQGPVGGILIPASSFYCWCWFWCWLVLRCSPLAWMRRGGDELCWASYDLSPPESPAFAVSISVGVAISSPLLDTCKKVPLLLERELGPVRCQPGLLLCQSVRNAWSRRWLCPGP
jgi:hypothetical protein